MNALTFGICSRKLACQNSRVSVKGNENPNYKNSDIFSISGEVNKPGYYPLAEGLKLADAIRMAGGLTNNGSINNIVAFGGTGSYLYSVNGGNSYSNTAYFNGYDAGTYTVEVFDENINV